MTKILNGGKKIFGNKKGILLIIVVAVLTVITVLTSVYLSTMVSERRSFDTDRTNMQILNLAESGANMALAELNKRLPGDMNVRLATADAATIRPYVTGNDPLGFLRNYAYITGTTQFTVFGSTATLEVPLPDYLGKGDDWDTTASIHVVSTGAPAKDSDDGPFRFYYRYWVSATSRVLRSVGPDNTRGTADDRYEQKTVSYSPNDFTVVSRHDNFAKFALFTSHHRTPNGTTVWFTADTNFNGPVHTNERFSFANNPSAHFTDEVSQHLSTVKFYNNGNSVLLSGTSNPICCESEGCETVPCKDLPQFDSTFSYGDDLINLPSSVTQTELRNQALGTMPVPGDSNRGVFLPSEDGALTGGIYINGNQGQSSDDATVLLGIDATSGDPKYTITQTRNYTTHTYVVTVDLSANQTQLVVDGGSPTTYNGKPDGVGDQGVIIYSDDDIKSFSGTVQKDTRVTVSSERDMVITNHVRYEEYTASPLSATGYDNILGILSWGGNIRIDESAPNDIQIHGIIMAHNGIFTVDDYQHGSPRGTATLLGGSITDFYGAFGTFSGGSMVSGYGRNFVYDRRVLDEGLTPPYFPYLTSYTSNIVPADAFRTKTTWRQEE
ncbi:MAG: DUF4900 domain-containing protein [Candidatus Omnitrophica bacterium]|nr:DUF4900 domain-containing protein [Candidatus Omnitrophota bacterium]